MPEISVAQSPVPKSVREGFRAALSLPADTLREIGHWIKAHPDFIGTTEFEPADFERVAADLNLTEFEFAQALSLVGTLLVYGDQPGDISALKDLGLSDQQDKVQLLLAAADIPHDEIEYSRQKGLALRSAIPTLEDVDALCDLRAVFRRLPSASSTERHTKSVKTLLGLEPVAIVSLTLNDAAGTSGAHVFQVSEKGLRNLIKTLQETLGQLELTKNVQKTLSLPRETS